LAGIYDNGGKTRLTASPGTGFCGLYAPDGSYYYTLAPGSGFCGSIAPDGSWYVTDASGAGFGGLYAPNGSLRVTVLNEWNGALRVSGNFGPVASASFIQNTYSDNLAALSAISTFTRADATPVATYFDSTGTMKTVAAAGDPRFDYSYNGSTWVPAGLLVEPSSSNNWLNSENAVLWPATNLTASVSALGVYGGFALATLTQTASASATSTNSTAVIASVNGDVRSITVFLLAVGSKTSAYVGLLGGSSTWGVNGDTTAKILTGPASAVQTLGGLWQFTGLSTSVPTIVRLTRTIRTTENVSGVIYLQTGAAGTAGDAIKVGIPMFEPGTGTSYVVAGGSPVTRAGDVAQLKGPALAALQGSQGAVIYEGSEYNPVTVFVGTGAGGPFALYSSGSSLLQTTNATNVLSAGSGTIPASGAWRGAVSWSAAGRSIVLNGGTVGADANSFGSYSSAYLGTSSTPYTIGGHIRSVAFFNLRPNNATLQLKSVPGASFYGGA